MEYIKAGDLKYNDLTIQFIRANWTEIHFLDSIVRSDEWVLALRDALRWCDSHPSKGRYHWEAVDKLYFEKSEDATWFELAWK